MKTWKIRGKLWKNSSVPFNAIEASCLIQSLTSIVYTCLEWQILMHLLQHVASCVHVSDVLVLQREFFVENWFRSTQIFCSDNDFIAFFRWKHFPLDCRFGGTSSWLCTAVVGELQTANSNEIGVKKTTNITLSQILCSFFFVEQCYS